MSGVPSIERLFVSPGHNFRGRYGQEPLGHPLVEVDEVECVAGRGLRGDRYFDHAPDFKGQVTFVARETLERLWEELAIPAERRDLAATRRNVVTSGIDLLALIGREFTIGGVRFLGTEECKPCSWMDHAIGEGAEVRLRGQGGLRARILSDGRLRTGPVGPSDAEPLP
jgi:MOSC domain-containing protein YiiM